VEIHRGADTITLEKTTADGKDTWKKGDGKDAETAKVDDLLGKLTACARSHSNQPATRR
jgi:hypothetical protein